MPEVEQRVMDIIYQAVDDLNRQLPPDGQLEKIGETALYGRSAKLDSLGLVNLIVMVEQKLQDAFDRPISLADERAMSQQSSPFRSIDTLTEYAASLLKEHGVR